MSRDAPFAVIVLPYAVELDGVVSYAVFRKAGRRDRGWRTLTGTGVEGEAPLESACREAWRLAHVPADAAFMALDNWAPQDIGPLPFGLVEHAFAVRVCQDEVRPRQRGVEHSWVSYEAADERLRRRADRDALWELRRRLGRPAACA
ncbi:MAG: hypothetical protein ACRDMZ_04080 [Solirubrobacteraceae bacterium]